VAQRADNLSSIRELSFAGVTERTVVSSQPASSGKIVLPGGKIKVLAGIAAAERRLTMT
jgi:hypothetical protein